ncbi:uncharacterized protein LOC132197871 [Neocloeon triangulifer]|uniref:uncharacterized protein LOC132197871 n=1 Tax=Neocloeon triangulifer TaxID=2078957 RepID=UPI00286F17DE|nr:uncharacterized protein LOC132197871 [Neocloeon triangulifer]
MLRNLLLACFFTNIALGFVDDGQLSFRNKTYIIGSKKMSWDKAFTYCAEKGMHLLNLENTIQNNHKWLTNYLDVKTKLADMRDDLVPPYWVSAACDAQSSIIKWVTPDVHPWLQIEPIPCSVPKKEDRICVTIYNNRSDGHHGFTFEPCISRFSFICEN